MEPYPDPNRVEIRASVAGKTALEATAWLSRKWHVIARAERIKKNIPRIILTFSTLCLASASSTFSTVYVHMETRDACTT